MASRHIHNKLNELCSNSPISAVDLFCGAGGLTHGLMHAGIRVEAGIDIDPHVEHAYIANNPGAKFRRWDVGGKNYPSVEALFRPGCIRLLAGCAPCTPFSKLTNSMADHHAFRLLDHFGRFVKGIQPDLVTMENVPELADRGRVVLDDFVAVLKSLDYHVDFQVVECPRYRVPQSRRRLVLLASRLGPISIPDGRCKFPSQFGTVAKTIKRLPRLRSGEEDPRDPLHAAPQLSDLNLRRIAATPKNGGTWRDWPDHLVLDCHKKDTGRTYGSIYGRMWWNKPAPTMTTLCTGLGNGRFGHPEQDRSITLREAALFQSFPRTYEFWPRDRRINRSAVSRMIGNAVPPKLAQALGEALMQHVDEYGSTEVTERHAFATAGA